MMRFEARVGSPKFADWNEFRKTFVAEFCPKNETQMALAKLETPSFYQSRRTVDEYVDEFRDLIDTAGYKEGLAIVIKFRRGLQRDIQDQIAQLPYGRPADDDPEAWYQAALQSAANREANATFHGVARTLPPRPAFPSRPPVSAPAAPRPFFPIPTFTPSPQKAEAGPVPMDIDVARRKAATPIICHRCGGPGHMARDCPRRYDIRYMTIDEHEEWMQEQALQRDAEEAQERAETAEHTAEDEDFQRNRE
jgi:Retrotransposon gag protein/Zinc knuckle